MASITKAIQGGTAGASVGSAAGPWGTAIGGGVGALAGLLSKNKKSKEEAALEAYQQALRNQQIATIEDRLYDIYDLEQAGLLTPEQEQALAMGDTELKTVQVDPEMRQIQMDALEQFRRRSQGEISPEMLQNINAIRQDAANQVQAQNQAILQNRAQRGIAGGGDELAAQMMSSQAAAQRANERGMQLATMADQQAIENLKNSAQLASNIGSEDYQRAANAARAQDVINQFNTQQRSGVQQRNVGARNAAQEANLREKQRIADINTQNKTQRSALMSQARQGYLGDVNARDLAVAGAALPIAQENTRSNAAQNAAFGQKMQAIGGLGQSAAQSGIFKKLFQGSNSAKNNEWAGPDSGYGDIV